MEIKREWVKNEAGDMEEVYSFLVPVPEGVDPDRFAELFVQEFGAELARLLNQSWEARDDSRVDLEN